MKKLFCVLMITILVLAVHSVFTAKNKHREINKQVVIAFYNKAINEKDFAAASQYLGSEYIQHDPMVADGPIGLKTFIQFLRDKYPNTHSSIERVFTDGDYVILQVHLIPELNMPGQAVFDLFRLKNNKIVEHWNVVQDIPEHTANANNIF